MDEALKLIEFLNLKPLDIEGGWYIEIYRSDLDVFSGRSSGTSIYYLLKDLDFSAFHKLDVDEIFHFYLGSPVEMFLVDEFGLSTIILGPNFEEKHKRVAIVPKGVWQASRLKLGGQFALLGTTTFPAFEFKGFTLGVPDQITSLCKNSEMLVHSLCKKN